MTLAELRGVHERPKNGNTVKRIMDSGTIHKLAVLGKDYYSIRTIGDLFLFAGADSALLKEPLPGQSTVANAWMHFIGGLRP